MAKAKARTGTKSGREAAAKGRAKPRARKPASEVEEEDEPEAEDEEVLEPSPARRRAKKAPRGRARKSPSRRARGSDAPERASEEPEAAPEPEEAPAPRKRRARGAPVDLGVALLQAAATNERVNQYLLEHLDPAAWNAKPPGDGRTIAAIVTHVHNVRRMWLEVAAGEHGCPEKLDRRTATIGQAKTALGESFLALRGLLERSLAEGGKVKDFKPDVVGFLAYVVAHEAHHRGQVALLARSLGFALPKEAGYGMWDWRKRWQECGFEA